MSESRRIQTSRHASVGLQPPRVEVSLLKEEGGANIYVCVCFCVGVRVQVCERDDSGVRGLCVSQYLVRCETVCQHKV